MLAAYFLKHHDHEDPTPGRPLELYTRLVTWSVHHYFITVLIGFGIFAASIWSIVLLPQGYLPAQDAARSLLAMELPPGSQLAFTEKVTEEIVARLRKRPEVESVFVDGGRVPPGIQEVRRAALIINYTPKNKRKITQRQLELEIANDLENVPDIRYWFLDENGQRAVQLVVTGTDSNIVANVASELANQMKRIPQIADVISETSLDRPELRIQPRADLAARLGVSTESLSQTVRVATIGDVGPALAKFDAGDRLVPIRVQLEDSARGDLQTLQELRVPLGEHGEKGGVPLSVVADIKLDQGPTSINRYDRERQATVAADLVGTAALGDVTKKINELPVMKSLPKSVKVGPSGDAEALKDLSAGFATAMTAGLMMVYAVLVLLFGTFLQPITILFSLPLSIGGAIGALLLTGKQLTVPVWIGMLMLMGIVTKNAIMLVEFAVEVDPRRQAARRGDHRRRPQARPSHRDDHDRDGRRHDAIGAGVRRRRRIPLANGAGRDRRTFILHHAVAGVRAGDVHDDGRSGRADLALRQEARRQPCRERIRARSRRPQGSAGAARHRALARGGVTISRCAPPRSACPCSATGSGRAAGPECRPCARAAVDG